MKTTMYVGLGTPFDELAPATRKLVIRAAIGLPIGFRAPLCACASVAQEALRRLAERDGIPEADAIRLRAWAAELPMPIAMTQLHDLHRVAARRRARLNRRKGKVGRYWLLRWHRCDQLLWGATLERRDLEIREGRAATIPWAEAKARALAAVRKRKR